MKRVGWIPGTATSSSPSPPSSSSSSTSSSSATSSRFSSQSCSSSPSPPCLAAARTPGPRLCRVQVKNISKPKYFCVAIKYFSAVTSTGSVTLRSCRAVMILVPIFGLHFLLLPIRPGKVSLEVATKAFSEFHENSVLGVLHHLSWCRARVWSTRTRSCPLCPRRPRASPCPCCSASPTTRSWPSSGSPPATWRSTAPR